MGNNNNKYLIMRIKCFNRFLVEEGCFFNYYNLLLKKYASKERIIVEFKRTFSKDWLSSFFIWGNTKEGIGYWSGISDRWEEYVDTLQVGSLI